MFLKTENCSKHTLIRVVVDFAQTNVLIFSLSFAFSNFRLNETLELLEGFAVKGVTFKFDMREQRGVGVG